MKDNFLLKNLTYPTLSVSDYRQEIKKLQERARDLTYIANNQGRGTVLVFEGWDAAGKGGSIRRLTTAIDPRLYHVRSIAAPNAVEKAHHYLWRFWTKLPPSGHVVIYDRSWYGRVLVERVEGFATQEEWSRSYNEIVEFEKDLTDSGRIVIKYWLHITPEEQLLRFTARGEDPLKRWKLTEEDWRNRDKWGLYEEAAQDMFQKTSIKKMHWNVIPAVDKYFTRAEVLRIFCKTLEKRLEL